MKISIHREGGLAHFPGLARPFTVAVEELAPALREQLTSLVDSTGIMHTDASSQKVQGGTGADRQTFHFAVEDKGQRRELAFDETTSNTALQSAYRLVEDIRKRSIAPPST